MAAFRIAQAGAQEELSVAPYQEWVLPGGERWLRFFRTETGYLLRFPDLADFELSGAAPAITCRPAPDTTRDTCEHLYLNQVLPLMLSRAGKLVFHASAVEVSGAAAAFLAESGRGKSTLAASFATGGHRFLADDGLVVEAAGTGFTALPSHPSLRLWEDSRQALVAGAAAAPPVQYTEKARLLSGGELRHCARPRPLRRAYFLGHGRTSAVRIERMGAAEAMMAWVGNSFLLEPKEPAVLAAHFGKVAELANTVPCYRLDYPRRFAELARVRRAVERHLQEEGVTA